MRILGRSSRIVVIVIAAVFLSACVPTSSALPTVSSVEMVQTAIVLTQNAPPPGFNSVAYPTLDARLVRQPSWHADVSVSFDGIDATTKQPLTAKLDAQIFSNELASTRRVLFTASGSALGVTEERSAEAVRLGNDYYWVLQNPTVCAAVTDPARRRIADLTAASLLGGIKNATATGQRDTINNLPVWEYTFASDDISLPLVHFDQVGTSTIAAGSLWIAPSVDAVARLTLTVNVENVRLLEGQQPVTGQLRITYELKDVGTPLNISVPFGC
jgi:hypothetical protein